MDERKKAREENFINCAVEMLKCGKLYDKMKM